MNRAEGDPGRTEEWEIVLVAEAATAFAARNRWPAEEAEDLRQDCLEHWLRVRHTMRPARGDPVHYVRRVIRRFILDRIRYRGAAKRVGDVKHEEMEAADRAPDAARSDPSAEDALVDRLRAEEIARLPALTSRQRAVCRLTLDEGLGPAAIAERLGVSPGVVYDEFRKIANIARRLRDRSP